MMPQTDVNQDVIMKMGVQWGGGGPGLEGRGQGGCERTSVKI